MSNATALPPATCVETSTLYIVVSVLATLLAALLAWPLLKRVRRSLSERFNMTTGNFTLRVRGSNAPPTLPKSQDEYNLFISHTWRTGQDQPNVLKRQLQLLLHSAKPKIFLDVDDLDDVSKLSEHVANSTVALLFLSKGYFHSRACLSEVRWCRQANKPLILVHERDPAHGGSTLEDLIADCPEELRPYVFGQSSDEEEAEDGVPPKREVIVWNRVKELHVCTLTRIAEALVRECAKVDSGDKAATRRRGAADASNVRLFVPGTLSEQPIGLSGNVEILTSISNNAAHNLGRELTYRFGDAQTNGRASKTASLTMSSFPQAIDVLLRKIDRAMSTGTRLCMLLVLDKKTFALNEQGDYLAQQVRIARGAHLPIMLVHDADSCDFDTCIEMTPDDLVTGGLYMKQIAIPLGGHALEQDLSHMLMLRHLQKLAPPGKAGHGGHLALDLHSLFGLIHHRSSTRRSSESSEAIGPVRVTVTPAEFP